MLHNYLASINSVHPRAYCDQVASRQHLTRPKIRGKKLRRPTFLAPGGGSAETTTVINVLGVLIDFDGVFCYDAPVAHTNNAVTLDYKDLRAKRLKKKNSSPPKIAPLTPFLHAECLSFLGPDVSPQKPLVHKFSGGLFSAEVPQTKVGEIWSAPPEGKMTKFEWSVPTP